MAPGGLKFQLLHPHGQNGLLPPRLASIINPEEEAMNALMRKKKEWEFQNERYFMSLVETSADVSVESVKKAGQVTSFLLYLAYKSTRMMLALASWTINGPKLVRYSNPEKSFETLETETKLLETRLQNPFSLQR